MKKLADFTYREIDAMLDMLAERVKRTLFLAGADRPSFVLLVFDDEKDVQKVTNAEPAVTARVLRKAASAHDRQEACAEAAA